MSASPPGFGLGIVQRIDGGGNGCDDGYQQRHHQEDHGGRVGPVALRHDLRGVGRSRVYWKGLLWVCFVG